MSPALWEPFARRILEQALREERAAELLECLMDGGSATVDATTGRLVLISAEQLAALVRTERGSPPRAPR